MASVRKLASTSTVETGARLIGSASRIFNQQQPTRCSYSTSNALASSIFSKRSRAQSRKLNEMFELEAPLQGLSAKIGDLAEPLAQSMLSAEREADFTNKDKDKPVYVPHVPMLCPISKLARDSETVREVLIFNLEKDGGVKPRMSWYHPDDTMIPRGWFQEGIMGDLKYYYSDVGKTKPDQ